MLGDVRTVIVDEIHAVAGEQARQPPGAVARAAAGARAREPLVRIGLSATQKPIDEVARFLVGAGAVARRRADCAIVDIGYAQASATSRSSCRRRRSRR